MFLRSSATGTTAPSEELAAELAALSDEALESRCRRSGVSSKDGRQAQVPTARWRHHRRLIRGNLCFFMCLQRHV